MATEPDLDPLRTAAEQAYTRQPGEPSAGYISDTDALTATGSTFDGIDLAVTYTTDTAADIAVDITELETADQNLSDSLAAAVTDLKAADAATDAALAAAVTDLEAADQATNAALAAAVTDLEAADAATDAALAVVDNRTLDTGWWQITTGDPALGEHVQAAVIRYRRYGPMVHVVAYNVTLGPDWSNGTALVELGPGLGPNVTGTAYLPNGCYGFQARQIAIGIGATQIRLYDHTPGQSGLRYMWTWMTEDTFPDPSTLVGTPQPGTKPA